MGKTKTKTLIEKQKQRTKLNAVLDYNEAQFVAMQKQDWEDLNDNQVNILENFIATALATMRICPPAYISVASNTVTVRAKAAKAISPAIKPNGEVAEGGTRHAAVDRTQKDLDNAIAEGRVKVIYDRKRGAHYRADTIPVIINNTEHSSEKPVLRFDGMFVDDV